MNRSDTCFVLMPFRSDLNEIYELVIKPTVEGRDVRCIRSDELFGTEAIIEDIRRGIADSSFVVADLTNRNPNVFYELGLTHASGTPAILIAQEINDIPSDLRHLRCVEYSGTPRGLKALETSLNHTISAILRKRGSVQDQHPDVLRCYPKRDLSLIAEAVDASQEIRLLDTTLTSFLGVADNFCKALERGGSVRLLCLDPESQFAQQRNDELGYGDGGSRFSRDIRLGAFQLTSHVEASIADPSALERFQLRRYRATPGCVALLTDDRVIVTWLLRQIRSRTAVHIESRKGHSALWEHIDEQFESLWSGPSAAWKVSA